MKVARVDRWDLRLDAGSVVKHPNGWLDVWGVATRVGVFEYDGERPGEVIREWRPPDEVLSPESLASLQGVPFTIDHPADAVDSRNFRDLSHGHVMRVVPQDGLVRTQIRIATDAAKAAIESGTVELSCGYDAILEEGRGVTPDGIIYDATQRQIRYNHLALVDLARAGHVARLLLDGRTARVQRKDQARGAQRVKTIKIDGKSHTLPALLVAGISAGAEEVKAAIKRGDAIQTGTVSIDGSELVLPKAMIDQILALLGASAPAEAPPMDADEPEDPAAPAPPRMDAAAIAKLVTDAATSAVEKALPKALQAREDRANERADLVRRCSPHLSAGYRFADADDLTIVVDTVEAVAPTRLDAAKALADKARKGDQRAAGRLDAILDDALTEHRDAEDSTGESMAKVFALRGEAAQRGEATKLDSLAIARAERLADMAERSKVKPSA